MDVFGGPLRNVHWQPDVVVVDVLGATKANAAPTSESADSASFGIPSPQENTVEMLRFLHAECLSVASVAISQRLFTNRSKCYEPMNAYVPVSQSRAEIPDASLRRRIISCQVLRLVKVI